MLIINLKRIPFKFIYFLVLFDHYEIIFKTINCFTEILVGSKNLWALITLYKKSKKYVLKVEDESLQTISVIGKF